MQVQFLAKELRSHMTQEADTSTTATKPMPSRAHSPQDIAKIRRGTQLSSSTAITVLRALIVGEQRAGDSGSRVMKSQRRTQKEMLDIKTP